MGPRRCVTRAKARREIADACPAMGCLTSEKDICVPVSAAKPADQLRLPASCSGLTTAEEQVPGLLVLSILAVARALSLERRHERRAFIQHGQNCVSRLG